jgi:tetratricopeptide (TPR) repeat protein
MARMPFDFDDPHPTHALLLAWLATDAPADRQRLIALHADMATADLAEDLLELAAGGPSYGGDREAESRFQIQLLELAEAVAERAGATGALAEARRLLAAALSDLPGSEERRIAALQDAADAARAAARPVAIHRAEWDLAQLLQALGRGREAIAAFDRALDAAAVEPALTAEADETLGALVRLAAARRRPTAAKAPIRRYVAGARGAGDRMRMGHAASLAGGHLLDLGLADEALPLLQEATALLGEMADDDALARAQLRLLGLALDTGDAMAAARHLEEVLRLRDRVGDPVLAAEIEEQFGRFF